MDSPGPRAAEPARHALATRRWLRLSAVTLWTGFLGAALIVVAAVAVMPPEAADTLGWAELSVGFLLAWALAMVPVSLALMLVLPGEGPSDER